MRVEVCRGAGSHRPGCLLPAAIAGTALRRAGAADRPTTESPGRAGSAAADVLGRKSPRRRSVRLRPDRCLRPVPANYQPPPKGAHRGRPAGPREARSLGLLPRPYRGAGEPRYADRISDDIGLTTKDRPPAPGDLNETVQDMAES